MQSDFKLQARITFFIACILNVKLASLKLNTILSVMSRGLQSHIRFRARRKLVKMLIN